MAKISPLVLIPPVLFAAMAGLFLSGMFREDPDALPSTLIGQPAPQVETATLRGKPAFDPAVLDGEGVKIVNFWASWCAPCRVEHPHLMTLATEGIPVYGINYKDDPAKAVGFLTELGDPYEAIGTDDGGRVALEWGVYGVPETFIIGDDGQVLLRFAGPITESVLANRIRPALNAARGAS